MKNKKRVEVGMLVYDISYGMSGVIVEKNPTVSWGEKISGTESTWDWGILYEDGEIGYADNAEIKLISEDKKMES